MTVRVTEAGRSGLYRCTESEVSDLASALRLALIEARSGDLAAAPPSLLPEVDPADLRGLFDPALDGWSLEEASARLQTWLERGESGELAWGSLRVVHATSQGIVRQAAATGVSLSARVGGDSGVGLASGAARRLDTLDIAAILARARERAGEMSESELPSERADLVLAPEAAARLLELFASTCLSADAFHRGSPLSVSHLARTIASPLLSLTDDATEGAGLAFPFDFEGHSKRLVLLLEDGRLMSPAVDLTLARAHSLAPTASAVAPNEARPAHLVVPPGASSQAELLAAGDGIWVSELEGLALTEAAGTRFRARARGARRIERGSLGATLPSFVWEADLLETLRGVAGVGRDRVCVSHDPDFYGSTVSPALRIIGASDLRAQ